MSKRTRPSRPSGPSALTGSTEAKRRAAVVLEVLSGLRSPAGAAEALGHSAPHYYNLEARALQGLIKALEPVSRGRKRTAESEIASLRAENERLQRELARAQAMLRASQRALGIRAGSDNGKRSQKASGTRKRKPRVRAQRTIAILRKQASESPATNGSGPPGKGPARTGASS